MKKRLIPSLLILAMCLSAICIPAAAAATPVAARYDAANEQLVLLEDSFHISGVKEEAKYEVWLIDKSDQSGSGFKSFLPGRYQMGADSNYLAAGTTFEGVKIGNGTFQDWVIQVKNFSTGRVLANIPVAVSHTVTFNVAGAGTVSVSSPSAGDMSNGGVVYVPHNGTLSFTATSADGGPVTVQTSPQTSIGSGPYTIAQVAQDYTINVTFTGLQTITFQVGGTGSGTVKVTSPENVDVSNGTVVKVPTGGTLSFTAEPAGGGTVSVSASTQAVSGSGPYTIAAVTQNNTITVTFTAPGGGSFTGQYPSGSDDGGSVGGGHSDVSYAVGTVSASNGTVSISDRNAEPGDTVTITATPDSGYEVGSVTVTDRNGKAVSVTKVSDTVYTFVMPSAGPVTVKVNFVRIYTPGATSTWNPFRDVSSGDYYYDAVLWAVGNGITAGTTATTFSPNAPCTRAQIVTFLWRAAGSPRMSAIASNPFTDVSSSDYYYDAVLWASINNITAGTTATTFSPDDTCTRAQAVSFLYRSNGSPAVSGTNNFTDLAAGAYYTNAVQWAVSTGVTAGTTNTTFSPGQNCTRAQIVSFLYRDRA